MSSRLTPVLRLLLAAGAAFAAGVIGLIVGFRLLDLFHVSEEGPERGLGLAFFFFAPAIVVAGWILKDRSARGRSTEASAASPLRPAEPAASNDEVDTAIALAQAPPRPARYSPTTLLFLSLAFFLVFGRRGRGFYDLLLLIGVLFLHELGHLAGMRAFGYRDLRMFFVPFFGALASGRKENAPGWQQGLVLLLGPLPGLVLSFVLLSGPVSGMEAAFAGQLLFINALNLLPLVPLDGGRFVRLLFARNPALQTAFSTVGLFGILVFAGSTSNWLLVGIAIFMLVLAPAQFRVAKAGAAVRATWPSVPSLADLTVEQARDLYARARVIFRTDSPRPPAIASYMRQVHEAAKTEAMSRSAAAGLLIAYAAGFVLIFAQLDRR